MKFLLSLALLLVLASAHYESMFRPVPSCDGEKTEKHLEKQEMSLEKLRKVVPMVCEKQTEDDASIKSVEEADSSDDSSDEEGEGEEKKMRKRQKGGKDKGRFDEVTEFLTAEKCVEAATDLEAVVQELQASLDPCAESITLEDMLERVSKRCSEEEKVEEESEQEEELSVEPEPFMQKMGKGKGKGKGPRKEKKERPTVCDMSDDEIKTMWANFFNADGGAVNKFEYDLGTRKMKVMNHLESSYAESCVKEVEDEETEALPEGLFRRLLRGRGGKRSKGGKQSRGGDERRKPSKEGKGQGSRKGGDDNAERRKPSKGEDERREPSKEGKGQNDEKREPSTKGRKPSKEGKGKDENRPGKGDDEKRPEKEMSEAMKLVAEFKEGCTEVTSESVNSLFAKVQEVMKLEKTEREAEMEAKRESMEKLREEMEAENTSGLEQMRKSTEDMEARRVEMEARRAERGDGEQTSEMEKSKRQGKSMEELEARRAEMEKRRAEREATRKGKRTGDDEKVDEEKKSGKQQRGRRGRKNDRRMRRL